MAIKTFKGDFSEIGKQLGEFYKKNGMNLKEVKVDKKLLHGQLEVYKKFYPELLIELEGINEVLGIAKDKFLFYFIAAELDWFLNSEKIDRSCSIFGVRNKNGLFIGRNYDWIQVAEKHVQAFKVQNLERNDYIGVTDTNAGVGDKKYLMFHEGDAINEHGLYMGLNFALTYQWNYGLRPAHMIRKVMENCKTVKEALKVFEETPLCYPKFFFIADKSGDMVVVEHTSRKFRFRRPEDDILIMTNQFFHEDLKAEDEVLKKYPGHTTIPRFKELKEKLTKLKKEFQYSDIVKVMTDKDSHVCQNIYGIRSIWSLALEMTKSQYKMYTDLCGGRKEQSLKFLPDSD